MLGLCQWLAGALVSTAAADVLLQPDAGQLQQQVTPSTQPLPPTDSELELPAFNVNEVKETTRFLIKSIRIIGNEEISGMVLHGLVKDYEGGEHSLADLQQACQRITDFYEKQGYGLARAIVPPQEVENGRVTIQVVEARYGEVKVDNKSRVRGKLIEYTLASFRKGESIEQSTLEKNLLLLSDIPGAQTSAILSAGQHTGESDLFVEMLPQPMVSGKLSVDDWGNRFINRTRAVANVNINNIAGYGDVLALNYLTTGERMQYARASYDLLVNGSGSRLGLATSYLHYVLGDEIKALRANGWANTLELYARQPLYRSRVKNLFINAQLVNNRLRDHVDLTDLQNDRDVRSLALSLNGDWQDNWLGGGVNSFNLVYTTGQVRFVDAAAKQADANSRESAGQFGKWSFNWTRLQQLDDKTQVWFSYVRQIALDNLDSSQKMSLGGAYTVRAYDTGTVSGDDGTLATLELRRFLTHFYGNLQAMLFIDHGRIRVNHERWAADTGENTASLTGAGTGVQWTGDKQSTVKLMYAKAIGRDNSLTEAGNHKILWFELARYF